MVEARGSAALAELVAASDAGSPGAAIAEGLQTAWVQLLKQGGTEISLQLSYELHSNLIAGLLDLAAQISEESRLVSESSQASYHLILLVVAQLP